MPLPIELLGIDLKHPNLDLEQLLLVVGKLVRVLGILLLVPLNPLMLLVLELEQRQLAKGLRLGYTMPLD